jgi:predicted nucleic acid-binding Zn ribbon protein
MDTMRDLLRSSLARSLRGMREEDRLAAAWTVACGSLMADHAAVVGFDQGVVRIEVADTAWMQQMISLRSVLARDMARIAGLPIAAIHFELKKH